MSGVIALLGLIVAIIGGIALLIAAFQENPLWGIAVFLFPIAGLVFTIAHWEEAKVGFLLQIGGILVFAMGGGLASIAG